jgi:hypothetical protein
VSAVAIIIIAIATSGVLMMRFCKRWLASTISAHAPTHVAEFCRRQFPDGRLPT